MKTYFSFSVVARIIASVFLFWALTRHQFGYFILLRWIVCGVTMYCAYLSYLKKQNHWVWLFTFLTIMFNPIIPIGLDRQTWAYFDMAIGLFLLTSIFFIRESFVLKAKSNSLVRNGVKKINEKRTTDALQINDLGIKWILVEGEPTGDFYMSSATLTGEQHDFYISATTITFDQYDKFCDLTGREKPIANFGRGKQPVINVNVADAIVFCEWLSKETGTTIRLPEENEWEFAACGGKKNKNFIYSGSNNVEEVAWYNQNSEGKTHEVEKKKPNEIGIFDMSGNVWEWCGTKGVIRGGGCFDDEFGCQVNRRDDYNPNCRHYYDLNSLGFRILQEKSLFTGFF